MNVIDVPGGGPGPRTGTTNQKCRNAAWKSGARHFQQKNGSGVLPARGVGRIGSSIIAVFLLLLCISPVAAAVKYSAGSPDFTASIIGTNEFIPGEDATIRILVQNQGVNLFKQVDEGTIPSEDLPNTAKFVRLELASTNPLITIKTDPQMVGDIPGNGGAVTASFSAKFAKDATEREYQLPLTIRYQYPVVHVQETSESYRFVYDSAEKVIPLAIWVKPEAKTSVLAVAADNLTPGSEGTIAVTIKNTGPESTEQAVAKITRHGQSAVIPVENSAFIGNYDSGETTVCRFKVAISDTAEAGIHPLDVSVTSRDNEGSYLTTSPVTIGITVEAEPRFEIVSPVPEIPAGSGKMVAITYHNTGTTTVYKAQSRIDPHAPLTIKDNVAYLGDIPPGGSATALHMVHAGTGAEPKEYVFDSKIRYRDAFDTSQESDTVTVTIGVASASGTQNLSGSLVTIAALVVAAIVISIAILVYRKKTTSR